MKESLVGTMGMKEILYRVSLKDKRTGERFKVHVWGKNCSEASGQLCGVLVGHDREYIWEGTGPEHDEHGNIISREV